MIRSQHPHSAQRGSPRLSRAAPDAATETASNAERAPWSPAPDSLGRLRILLLLIWVVASFGLPYFGRNIQHWLGSNPSAFWWMAQGMVIVFVLIVALYAVLANRSERVHWLSGTHDDG